jgi:recombinational DNA repair protein RecR
MTPLAQLLARLPRVGEATAARLATAIGDQPEDYREALARAITAQGAPSRCPTCCDDLGITSS